LTKVDKQELKTTELKMMNLDSQTQSEKTPSQVQTFLASSQHLPKKSMTLVKYNAEEARKENVRKAEGNGLNLL
jgi:hypothetical protein